MKEYWPSAIVAINDERPFRQDTNDSCLSLEEAQNVIAKWRDIYDNMYASWIAVYENKKRIDLIFRCYVDYFGFVPKL